MSLTARVLQLRSSTCLDPGGFVVPCRCAVVQDADAGGMPNPMEIELPDQADIQVGRVFSLAEGGQSDNIRVR